MSGDGLRLRCCRRGHGQRLRGDDCRLAGDYAKGVGLREEREAQRVSPGARRLKRVFFCADSCVQMRRELGSMREKSLMGKAKVGVGGGGDGRERFLPLDREPWRQKEQRG